MYTPIRFVNQTENMITVPGHNNMKGFINRKHISWVKDYYAKDSGDKLIDTFLEWNIQRKIFNGVTDRVTTKFRKDMFAYARQVGAVPINLEEFLHSVLLVHTTQTWNKSKRVYKIEQTLMDTFCNMKTTWKGKSDVFTRLPSNCFYIDYNGNCPFSDRAVGCIVTFVQSNNRILWHMTNLIEGARVKILHTTLYGEKSPNSDTIQISLEAFGGRKVHILEDGSHVEFDTRMFVKFFINFCMYLYAANNDVTYVEATSTPKRKKTKTVKDPKTDVFEVGFKRAAAISASKKRVRYPSGSADSTSIKRAYSSTYRCAHWHRYWINDPENHGEKKLILKWVEETFVQGNREDNSVKIHPVVK